MATFVPQVPTAAPAQMLALASAVNAALRGDTANVGMATCAATESEITIRDDRCPFCWMPPLPLPCGGFRP